MGRKYPSDLAERRRAKRSENQDWRLGAYAESLSPDVEADLRAIDRYVYGKAGQYSVGPPPSLAEIRDAT
jgi:hypothetical protein